MKFKNKVVLITGAANGLGKAVAELMGHNGALVVMLDHNASEGIAAMNELKSKGMNVCFFNCNVADESEVKKVMSQIEIEFGGIDIAINNAGIGGDLAPTHLYPTDTFDHVMAVNTKGVFLCMKYQLEVMINKKIAGCILNVSSAAGLCGMANNIAYTASKHAVIGLTKAAALEYAKHNIRINAICPSFTMTNMVDDLFNKIGVGKEILKNNIPMKRFAEPDEIAEVMAFLCSDKNTFMTGAAVPVDGGFLAT
jgi:NAD(P)-dependent dehydrogenase (short-subunit alcohol dehydrogenase family)